MQARKCNKTMCEERLYGKSDWRKWTLKNHPDKVGSAFDKKKWSEVSNCRERDLYCQSSSTVKELRQEAKRKGCRGYSKLTKKELFKFLQSCRKEMTVTVKELRQEAKRKGCRGYSKLTKKELVQFLQLCRKDMTVKELKAEARRLKCKGYSKYTKKADLQQFLNDVCKKS